MQSQIRAVVFKTPRLNDTKKFYEEKLGLKIIESSSQHFVIDTTGMRLVFKASCEIGVEVYLVAKSYNRDQKAMEMLEDANDIRFVLCRV